MASLQDICARIDLECDVQLTDDRLTKLEMYAAQRFVPLLPREAQKCAAIIYKRASLWKRRLAKVSSITKTDITRDLIKLGVKPGDLLFVHSSLSSIGYVPNGANEVIDAILDALTPSGTLAMPASSLTCGSMLHTLEQNNVFDPAKTPSTAGLIPETFRTKTGAKRSIHPTCSVCALGAKANWITEDDHLAASDFGIGTPLYKIMEANGKILGIGVTLGPLPFYHVIEDVLGNRFPIKVRMDKVYDARVLDQEGKQRIMRMRPLDPDVARTRVDGNNTWLQNLLKDFLVDRGILKIGKVGKATSWLIEAKQLYEAQLDLLKRGITIYTTKPEYDATGQKLLHYISAYRSVSSSVRHDYLGEQVRQIAKIHQMKGFWDGKSGNWIRQLNWTGNDWSSFVSHDWKYAIELQEGATQYALITGSDALDDHLRDELEYIHSRVRSDGSVVGIPDRHAPPEYEYAGVLSALTLGYSHFKKRNPALASKILPDLDSVHHYVTSAFRPTFDDPFSIVLKAYANLLSTYQILERADKVQVLQRQVSEYAVEFLRHQTESGLFPVSSAYGSETGVHIQLKIDIALLLSCKFTGLERYLVSAAKNLEWVTKNLMLPNGALRWDLDNETDFFEIHQMLYLIACRYLRDLSNGKFDYEQNVISAWKFLLEENIGLLDMYDHNLERTNAFFSFRHIDDLGRVQEGPYSAFKGSYEIGYALWALALNRDLAP